MNPVEAFEQQIREVIDVKHAIAVDHGSSALYISLLALDLRPGEVVVTTPFTFVATAEAIVRAGGRPFFADIDAETYCLDPERVVDALNLLSSVNTRVWGVLPVHLFGRMADVDALNEICYDRHLKLLEDASQAFGVTHDGKHAGTFGHAGTYSFYASKMPYTYEGGAIVTEIDEVAEACRQIRNHGMDENGDVVRLGGNYRLAWPLASHGETMLRLHRKASLSEIGTYGLEQGYYPRVVYDHPFYRDTGRSYCPIAEEAAEKVKALNSDPLFL